MMMTKCKYCGWSGILGYVWEKTDGSKEHGYGYIRTMVCPRCEKEGLEPVP